MRQNTINRLLKLLFFVVGFFLITIPSALASVDKPTGSLKVSTQYDESIKRFSDVNTFLTSLVDFALGFVAILAIAAIIYGGFLMITSQGEEDQHKKGMTVIMYAVIGIVVILASYAIVNTVTAFGTGTEGVPGPADQELGLTSTSTTIPDKKSDDINLIYASLEPSITVGTVPLAVNFTTEGSYNLSSNQFEQSDYYWNLNDDSNIQGILSKEGTNTVFKPLDSSVSTPIIARNSLLSSYGNSACSTPTLCLEIDNSNAYFQKTVNNALDQYNRIVAYFQENNTQLTDLQKLSLQNGIANTSTMAGENKFPVLIYGQRRQYSENDPSTSTLILGDAPQEGSDVIEIFDPGTDGFTATILNPYGLNLGQAQVHKYLKAGNFKPTVYIVNDRGTPLMPTDDLKSLMSIPVQVSRDNIDPNRVPPTAAFVYNFDIDNPRKIYFENKSLTDTGEFIANMLNDTTNNPLDLDLATDSDNDGMTSNDNDVFYFEWDFDIDKDSSGDGNKVNDIDWTSTTGLIMNPDGVNEPEKRNSVFNIFTGDKKVVRVKFMVKNRQTQDYDTVVREITFDQSQKVDNPQATSLFGYTVIPGSKDVLFNNKSMDSEGNGISLDSVTFNWDFDTKSELSSLLLKPETDPTKSYSQDGTLMEGSVYNRYTNDGTVDNDTNTTYHALGANEGMMVTFPKDSQTYKVRLSIYDKNNKKALLDSRTIDVYIPPVDKGLPPIPAFTWSINTDDKVVFQNRTKVYDIDTNSFSYLQEGDITAPTSISNYEISWDLDLSIDSDGDGDPENDIDNTYKTGELTSDGITFPDILFVKEFQKRPQGVKLVVNKKTGNLRGDITHSVDKSAKIIVKPFTYTYVPPTNEIDPIPVNFSFDVILQDKTIKKEDLNVQWDFDTDDSNDPCSSIKEISLFEIQCSYKDAQSHNVQVTVTSPNSNDEFSHTGIILLETKPPLVIEPVFTPTSAFTFKQDDIDDLKVVYTNRSILGEESSSFFYDFDLNYDSDGDGNSGNDKDILNEDNSSFKVTKGNDTTPFEVVYKEYRTYNVKLTAQVNNRNDTVIRKVVLSPRQKMLPPVSLFTYNKKGSLVSFTNRSIDGYGDTIAMEKTCSGGQKPKENKCYKYEWYFNPTINGDGSYATSADFVGYGPNIEHDYSLDNSATVGEYEPRLVLTGPDEKPTLMKRRITLSNDTTQRDIYANIVATPKSGTSPLTVTFSTEGTKDLNGTIKNYYWDFDGDGTPDNVDSQSTNITYTYTVPGHYRAGLAVEGPSGKAISFTWIDVYGDPPKATILVDKENKGQVLVNPYIGYVNNPLKFRAFVTDKGVSTSSYAFNWDMGISAEQGQQTGGTHDTPQYTFKVPGTYEVTFTVKNTTRNLERIVKRNIKILPARPTARIRAKAAQDNDYTNTSEQSFFAASLDINSNRFDIKVTAKESEGANKDGCITDCEKTNLVKYKWDFGDNQTTTSLNKDEDVAHSYQKAGTFVITLEIIDEQGAEGIAKKTVFVADPRKPVPSIKITPTRAQTGRLITFDASSSHSSNGLITDYLWQIGQSPFTDSNPGIKLFSKMSKYSFTKPGVYDVQLTVKDKIGEKTTILLDNEITIESSPPIAKLKFEPDINIPNKIIFDGSESFDGDNISGLTYTWSFGDGQLSSSSTKNPIISHIYNDKGRFTVKLTVADDSNQTSFEEAVIRIDNLLFADIWNIVPRAGKAPLEVAFEGTGGYQRASGTSTTIDESSVVLYEWNFGDGTILTKEPQETDAKNPRHTFTEKGKFNVVLTVYDNNDESAKSTQKVYIGSSDPAPIAILEARNLTSFRGVPLRFDASKSLTSKEVPYNSNLHDLEFTWDFGDDSDLEYGEAIIDHTFTELGTFVVTVTVKDPLNNKTSKDSIQIKIIKSAPQARFTASPSYGPSPLLVNFDASNSSDPDNNIDFYQWEFTPKNIITTKDKTIDFPLTNNSTRSYVYIVTLKVVDLDNLSDIYKLPVTVFPAEE